MKISIVIPVRNEVENLRELRRRLESVTKDIKLSKYDFEVIVNDNNSSDGSLAILRDWALQDKKIFLQEFRIDVGFQKSLLLGMRIASGDALIVLQSDLQDPPEMILDFIDLWEMGNTVVGAVIKKRYEPKIVRASRKLFYWLLNLASDQKIITNFQDFYLLDKSVYIQLRRLNLNYAFLRVEIASKFGIGAFVTYSRQNRTAGKSKFGFANKYTLAMDALLLYGLRLNRVISVIFATTSIFFFLSTLILLILPEFNIKYSQQGWLSIMSLCLLSFSFLFFMSSIIIEYLSRIYRLTMENPNIYT